jgi:triosephosphate isomerase
MTFRRKWVMGNWKMNGDFEKAKDFFDFFLNAKIPDSVDVSFAIPTVYIKSIHDFFHEKMKGQAVYIGAQNVSEHDAGAYTGEVSVKMLAESGARYVLVGHSERRQFYGETDLLVAKKVKKVFEAGLIPVVCVGETLLDREAGRTEEVIRFQVESVLESAGIEVFEEGVLAYEPVWAIGTGLAATPEQVQSVHAFLRKLLMDRHAGIAAKTRIVYGGSLKSSNADALFALADVDGGLVGGASLDRAEFFSIIQKAAEH